MNTQEKRQKVVQLVEQNRQLLDKAADEGRNLTTEEAAEFDRRYEEVQALNQELGGTYQTRAEALEAAEAYLRQSQGALAGASALAGATDPFTGLRVAYAEPEEAEWRDQYGRTTRAMKPGESVRDYIRSKGNYDPVLDEVRLGDVMRAMVTGSRNEAERRALSMGIDTAGGYTVPPVLAAQVIDLMRPLLVVGRSGCRYVPLEGGAMTFATVEQDPDPKWRGENQAVAEEEVIFGSLTVRPRVVAMIVKASYELLEASPNIASLLERTLARTMALKEDKAALMGNGKAIEPLGVANWKGIHTLEHNSTPNYDMLLRARTKLLMSNSQEPRAAIMNPRDEGTISRIKDGEGKPYPVPPKLQNLPILTTTQMPIVNDTGTCIVGDFRQMFIAQKVVLRIQVLQERYADFMQKGFLVWAMLDTCVEQPEAFCKITGLTEPAN